MAQNPADQMILGFLGRALSLEYSAVQLYSTQSRLVANWGLQKVAEQFQAEALEEMQHAERIIARMLALGFAPNSSQLRPVKLAPDLLGLLRIDREFERHLVKLYDDAVRYCVSHQRHEDRALFQQLLEDEQKHEADLEQWIESLKTTP